MKEVIEVLEKISQELNKTLESVEKLEIDNRLKGQIKTANTSLKNAVLKLKNGG